MHLEPLAVWCDANYIEKRVHKIDADKNSIHLEDNTTVAYDVLGVNVGSRTKGANEV